MVQDLSSGVVMDGRNQLGAALAEVCFLWMEKEDGCTADQVCSSVPRYADCRRDRELLVKRPYQDKEWRETHHRRLPLFLASYKSKLKSVVVKE
jgi:hypothetical protein